MLQGSIMVPWPPHNRLNALYPNLTHNSTNSLASTVMPSQAKHTLVMLHAVKFWNDSLSHCNSDLFRDVLCSDVGLAREGCKECWTGEMLSAVQELPDCGGIEESLLSRQCVDWGDVDQRVCQLYSSYWEQYRDVHTFRAPDAPSRKTLTYSQCFRSEECFPALRDYFHSSSVLPLRAVRSVARFRLGSHNLEVERQKFQGKPYPERCCTRCSPDFLDGLDIKVDDEHHMLFDCEVFAHLRTEPFAPCDDWNGEAWCDRTIRFCRDC